MYVMACDVSVVSDTGSGPRVGLGQLHYSTLGGSAAVLNDGRS